MNKNFRNSRRALAPAIAVALLLAITIALVAAVGYAVTNVTPSAEVAPQGTFNVEITKRAGPYFTGYVSIKQISGDAIDTSKIKLKFTVNGQTSEVLPKRNNTFCIAWGYPRNATFNPFNLPENLPNPTQTFIWLDINEQAPTSAAIPVRAYDNGTSTWVTATSENFIVWGATPFRKYVLPAPSDTYTAISVISSNGLNRTFTSYGWGSINLKGGQASVFKLWEYNAPWLYSVGATAATDPALRFGEYVLTPGNTMKAIGTSFATSPTDDIHSVIPSWATVKSGDVVNVMIIYTETNQVIWQGDVIVG